MFVEKLWGCAMPTAKRRADVVWEGNLREGHGEIESSGSGALRGLPISWEARAGESGGKTSPEELIAAAHAACYCMALSNALNEAGHAPQRLEVSAVCTFEVGEGGARIASVALDLRGHVRGIDEGGFRKAAEGAKDGCPVSKALKGNVEITLEARLET
jgi:osmotically inducible protein OsmC